MLITAIAFILTIETLYGADNCGVDPANSASFTTSSDAYAKISELEFNSHHQYYFNITTAGTLTIITTSSGDKIKIAYSDNTCPSASSSDSTTQTVTVTSATDINVDLLATSDRSYTITATFQPSPLEIIKINTPLQTAINTETIVTYTLSAKNHSESDLSNIHVTDTLPAGITIGSDSNITHDSGWDCSASSAPSTINCTLGTLTASSTKDINIITRAFSATAQNIVNTATATADGGWNASDSSTLAVLSGAGEVDLEIQKFASNDVIPPNTNFSYLFFVINYDNDDAHLVQVTDTLPPLADGNITILSGGGNGWTCTFADDINTNDANRTFVCDYNQPLGKEITYFLVNAHTGDYNNTFNVSNCASVDALNDISGAHSLEDCADINISTEGGTGGSSFTGFYTFGGSIEVSDEVISNRANAQIWTKIASTQNTTFPVYFVNPSTGAVMDYNGTTQNVPLTVVFKLTDENCSVANETYLSYDSTKSVIAEFDHAFGSVVNAKTKPDTTYDLRNIATRNARLLMKYIDINSMLDVSGESCSNSNLSSNIKGIPQCIANSTGGSFDNNKYINVFGIEAFVRCAVGNGQPCSSNNHGVGDSPYDTEYGCYECTLGGQGFCSKDNFAIRPNNFSTTLLPNPFKAGQGYSITFEGEDFNGDPTNSYDENENDTFVIDVNISDSTRSCQEPSINFTPSVNFTNGVVTDNYALGNVGDFNMSIYEPIGTEFAIVDNDDTNDNERLITPFFQQIKVIPHHFGIEGSLLNGSNGFTYLSNFQINDTNESRNISASLDLNVSAQRENNTTTSNYTSVCYAKDGNLKLTLANPIIVTPAGALNNLLWYHYTPDSNGSIPLDGITVEYTFPYLQNRFDSNDVNGTAEFNYRINFDRNLTREANPFIVIVDEINATDTDNASGINPIDSNATFIFGRTHASRQRYQGDTGTANIYFESYCFGAGCNTTLLNGFSPALRRTDDVRWYVNEAHVAPANGNIGTVQQKDATPLNAADDVVDVTAQRNNLNPSEADLDYDESRGYPYKTTMHNDASPWLIYSESDPTATRNEFQVEFDNQGTWTGEHETNTTTKSVGGTTSNRRIMW